MSIQATRDALDALADLHVDPNLPGELDAAGVDHTTVAQVSDAVSTGLEALEAQRRAQQAENRAAAHPDDLAAERAAASLRAHAEHLRRATAEAARHAKAGLDERHGPVELAMADAGGTTQLAEVTWYDD